MVDHGDKRQRSYTTAPVPKNNGELPAFVLSVTNPCVVYRFFLRPTKLSLHDVQGSGERKNSDTGALQGKYYSNSSKMCKASLKVEFNVGHTWFHVSMYDIEGMEIFNCQHGLRNPCHCLS